jgi:hypothetical protein
LRIKDFYAQVIFVHLPLLYMLVQIQGLTTAVGVIQ